ncbi:MAG: MerR family transcriptional regulator [Bacteroides sp.]|nr:MerR family transcriptional regulator [Bacteroides sp.]MCM1550738.1 MerR family transcriptional regulator [Clostridium sp.]
MSLYTTGELAKKCNVSVRTIQYYDERGILVPTDLTEGGRRLFSEEDAATLETICFLRDLDISIKDIAEILESDESKKVIELLLDEQDKNIQEDIKRKTEQLEKIKGIRNALASFKDGSQKTIHDISSIMEEKEKLKKMYQKMLIIAIPLEAAEIVTFVIGILEGIWIPFFMALAVFIICTVFLINDWYKQVEYICPECHARFQPKKIEVVLGNHTPKMRKLTCPNCKRKIWSLEVYRKEVDV